MACPYFMPERRLEGGGWPHPARLPLGCGWSGHCTAPGHAGELPSQEVLESSCNLGYASGCGWSPAERLWDAVRFAVSAPTVLGQIRGAGESLRRELCLIYVCEKDHLPVERGELQFDLIRGAWQSPHPDPRVQKMAECFLETYLKKKT